MTKESGALLTDNIHKIFLKVNKKVTVVPGQPSDKCPYPRSLFRVENKCYYQAAFGLLIVYV